jgi:hypothetical protein
VRQQEKAKKIFPLDAFGVSGIFISSPVKASFARFQNKKPLIFDERFLCPGLDFLRTLRVLRRS